MGEANITCLTFPGEERASAAIHTLGGVRRRLADERYPTSSCQLGLALDLVANFASVKRKVRTGAWVGATAIVADSAVAT